MSLMPTLCPPQMFLSLLQSPTLWGLTSQEPQPRGPPQILGQAGRGGKNRSFPYTPGAKKKKKTVSRGPQSSGVFTVDQVPQFTCDCLQGPHFTPQQ